jgi:hypothetical protein
VTGQGRSTLRWGVNSRGSLGASSKDPDSGTVDLIYRTKAVFKTGDSGFAGAQSAGCGVRGERLQVRPWRGTQNYFILSTTFLSSNPGLIN